MKLDRKLCQRHITMLLYEDVFQAPAFDLGSGIQGLAKSDAFVIEFPHCL